MNISFLFWAERNESVQNFDNTYSVFYFSTEKNVFYCRLDILNTIEGITDNINFSNKRKTTVANGM